MSHYLLAIDQGTTNSRAIVFNQTGTLIAQAEIPLKQFYPSDAWVEQDPEEMFLNTVSCCRQALEKAQISANQIAGIGISNQRETTIIWDKLTGQPIYPAIVWQDRRTALYCQQMEKHPITRVLQKKTGLLLDSYFSATKIVWILENVPFAREKAKKGELAFGTVDSYLIWKLSGGKHHVTDATNASRTMLFNIHTQQWDQEILAAFDIPEVLLPKVLDCSAHFAVLDKTILGVTLPITGVAGDQQAATIGQACFQPGMIKTTYGTGAFMLLNTGSQAIESKHHLLSTIAYRFGRQVTYGLEGSIFCAGVTIKWLRDSLRMIHSADETEVLAKSVHNTEGVYLVPAFTGLGAPYWNPHARGALLGLTRNTQIPHIVRAALEAVAYQSQDLLRSMLNDSEVPFTTMRVDGGMVANGWLLQFLADILQLEIQRPACIETSALGVAYLAGLQVGLYQSLDEISEHWQVSSSFHPIMHQQEQKKLYDGWIKAVQRVE